MTEQPSIQIADQTQINEGDCAIVFTDEGFHVVANYTKLDPGQPMPGPMLAKLTLAKALLDIVEREEDVMKAAMVRIASSLHGPLVNVVK